MGSRLAEPFLDFNIHDVIRLRTNLWFANLPEYFRVDSVEPNLTFERVDRLTPSTMGTPKRTIGYTAYELENERLFFESPDPVMSALGMKAKWKVLMSGLLGDSTRIVTAVPYYAFKPVRLGARQMLSKLARAVFLIKLIRRGFAVCHATAMAAGNDADLFFGFSGSGKSTIAATLMDRGYSFLADDFAIVDPSGRIYCYPDWHEPYTERSGLSAGIRLVQSPSHSVKGLRIRDRAVVRSIVLVERGPDEVVVLDEAEAIRRIMLLNMAEDSRLWNSPASLVLNHYSYFFPEFDLEAMITTHRESVHAFVKRAKRFVILRSSSPTFANVDHLLAGV